MAPHSSTLAWEIPWTEEPGGLQPMGSREPDTTWLLKRQQYATAPNGCVTPVSCVASLSPSFLL